MRKSVIAGIVCLAIFAVMVAGCKVSTANPAKGASASAAAAAVKKNPYKDPIKVAFLPDNIGDTVGAAWGVGIKRELAYFPNVAYQVFDGKLSPETQISIMKDLINQKYDCIILQAHDAAALAASVKEAESAGIPVINLNLDAQTPHTALVAMVDYEAGAIVAGEIAKGLGDDGNVVIIQAPPGASRGINVEAGFRDGLKDHPKVVVLGAQNGEWLTEKGNEVMRDFMTKYPKIGAVFAINDAMAEGASQAAAAAGRKMIIWGADGEKKALQYIEQGKLTGTIYTNCYDQGATAARMAMYAIGAEVDGSKFTKTPIIKMAPIVVTKSTVASIAEKDRW
jgi:ribose transport system substrate-binding protein